MASEDPVDQLADLLLFAPIGLLTQARQRVPELASAGRNQVQLWKMIGQFAVQHGTKLVGQWADQQRSAATTRSSSTSPASNADSAPATVIDAAPATVIEIPVTQAPLPIADYDDLAASQIVALLGELDDEQRAAIRAYESSHRKRSTVIGKLDRLDRG
jgi:hypothetical protein